MENLVAGPSRPALTYTIAWLHLMTVVGLVLYPPWTIGWSLFVGTLVFFAIRSLSITVMHHRFWTHMAFKCHRAMQYLWAFCSIISFEGSGMIPEEVQKKKRSRGWVLDHRQHHRYTDTPWDPHSPRVSFWWAHYGWLGKETLRPADYNPIDLLQDDPVARFQYHWYLPIAVGFGFVLPMLIWGLPGLFWCGFIGVVLHLNSAWMVNSVCHLWGRHPVTLDGRPYTADDSRNNRFVAAVTMGEGNHGNHHRQQNSAQLGEHWYDFDFGWLVIWLMEQMGLAWDVNRIPRKAKA